jgi:hypothetical protein
MMYLENPICELQPLFEINYNIKKNIFSASFFKMYTTSYKDFSKYTTGLVGTSNYINEYFPGWKIRLFIDNEVYNDSEIMNIITKLRNVELVLFRCSVFLVKKNMGLFATMLRFFPMFDFPNNDAKTVSIIDIDTTVIKDTFNILQKIELYDNVYLIKVFKIKDKYGYTDYYKGVFNPYTLAFNIVSCKRLPYEILINFLIQVKTIKSKYSYYYDAYKINSKILPDAKDDFDKKFKIGSNFHYGVDEYFLNTPLMEYVIDNKIPFTIHIDFNIFLMFGQYKNEYILNVLTKKNKKQLNELLNKIIIMSGLEHHLIDNDDIIQKYQYIYSFVFDDKLKFIKNQTTYDITKSLYILIVLYSKNPEYRFIFPEILNDMVKSYMGKYFMTINRVYFVEKSYFEELLQFRELKKSDIRMLELL